MSKSRLYYIDNLRILLIALVVLHHFAITYGAPGGWYYNESEAVFPTIVPMSMFVATNQAFFMGMFFFISAFFIVPSLQRKGNKRFVSDRLVRLGIPSAIFYFLISPFTVFLKIRFIEQNNISFFEVLQKGWGMSFGPMWFVEALLLFTAVYLLVRTLKINIKFRFPSTAKIIVAALLVGLGQFLIRTKISVGESHEFTNFQFPFFLQYMVLFPLGIIAWQNNWMEHVNSKMGWRWFIFAQALIFIGFPLIFVLGGGVEGELDKYMGGYYWQCFAYAMWEQLLGFSLIVALFGIFKKKFNSQGKLAKKLSESAYGVYVFHAPILVATSALFLNFSLQQLIKYLILSPLVLLVCFGFAWLVKQIPGVNRVL